MMISIDQPKLMNTCAQIIPFPSPFLTTLSEPLISTTPSGLTIARSLINLFDSEQVFNGAMGITAFLPTDENVVDITKALANNRNSAAQQNLLFNHVSGLARVVSRCSQYKWVTLADPRDNTDCQWNSSLFFDFST
jgi:hypothetical protein